MQALVHGIAALLERQQPDVRVLDGQELEDALAQQMIVSGARRTQRAAGMTNDSR